MRNIFKLASKVSMIDINSAVQQYIADQYFQKPPKTGGFVTNGKHQPMDQHYRIIDDGSKYINGMQYDSTPRNQQQLQLLQQYKQKRKQFIKNIHSDKIYRQFSDQQKLFLLDTMAQSDPTADRDNPIGNYSDVVLNLYKNKQFLRNGGTLGQQLQYYLRDINAVLKQLKVYNIPIKSLNQVKTAHQIKNLFNYYTNNLYFINQLATMVQQFIKNIGHHDNTNIKAWLMNICFKQGIDIWEDNTSVNNNIIAFLKFVKQGKIKINKSLGDNTYQQLSVAVQKLGGFFKQVQPSQQGSQILKILQPISQSGPYKLFSSNDAKVIQQIGCNTSWCTRKETGDNSRALQYIHDQNGMYFVTRDDKVILQMMPKMSQFMDTSNRDVSDKIFKLSDQNLKAVLVPYFKRVVAQSTLKSNIHSDKLDVANKFLQHQHQQVTENDYIKIINDCLELNDAHSAQIVFNKAIKTNKLPVAVSIIKKMISHGDILLVPHFITTHKIDSSVIKSLSSQMESYILNTLNQNSSTNQPSMYRIIKTIKFMKQNKIQLSETVKTKLLQIATKQAQFAIQPQHYAWTQFGQALSTLNYAGIDFSNLLNMLKKQANDVISQGGNTVLNNGSQVKDYARINKFANFIIIITDMDNEIRPHLVPILQNFNRMLLKIKEPVTASNWFTKII